MTVCSLPAEPQCPHPLQECLNRSHSPPGRCPVPVSSAPGPLQPRGAAVPLPPPAWNRLRNSSGNNDPAAASAALSSRSRSPPGPTSALFSSTAPGPTPAPLRPRCGGYSRVRKASCVWGMTNRSPGSPGGNGLARGNGLRPSSGAMVRPGEARAGRLKNGGRFRSPSRRAAGPAPRARPDPAAPPHSAHPPRRGADNLLAGRPLCQLQIGRAAGQSRRLASPRPAGAGGGERSRYVSSSAARDSILWPPLSAFLPFLEAANHSTLRPLPAPRPPIRACSGHRPSSRPSGYRGGAARRALSSSPGAGHCGLGGVCVAGAAALSARRRPGPPVRSLSVPSAPGPSVLRGSGAAAPASRPPGRVKRKRRREPRPGGCRGSGEESPATPWVLLLGIEERQKFESCWFMVLFFLCRKYCLGGWVVA